MRTGYISYYILKKGIGFILDEDGTSYFFHISKVEDGTLYQGSPVSFDVESADEKSDKAINIKSLNIDKKNYGVIKFHNRKERFGVLHAAGDDCAFTQVNGEETFYPGQFVTFASRYITMREGDEKRVAYAINPVDDTRVHPGEVRRWDGQYGSIVVDGDEDALPFDSEMTTDPTALEPGTPVDVLLSSELPVFVHPRRDEPTQTSVACVVNLNRRQNYVLVAGPGIPRAIISNPAPNLRYGAFVRGQFNRNERGFECVRHEILPQSEVLYGTVCDKGTRVLLTNAVNLEPLELEESTLLGKKGLAWKPQDGETCELVRNADGSIALARKGFSLRRFADLGDEDRMLQNLAAKTHPGDRWDFMSTSVRTMPILWSYLFQTFAKLEMEEQDPDMNAQPSGIMTFEVPKEDNPAHAGEYAALNTGLITRFYEDIFALFKKVNPALPGRPAYQLLSFDPRGSGHGQLLAYLDPLPRRARYFTNTADLVFDTEARIDTNFEHIITDRSFRIIPDPELQNASDRSTIERRLGSILQTAINTVHNRLRWNYKTAIPQYFPAKKKIQFLLPLCLDPGRPDNVEAVLVVEKVGKVYQAFTVLRMDWAYSNARLIARTDSDWLTPDKIMSDDPDM